MSLKGLGEQENVVIDQTTTFLDNCFKCLGCCCADFANEYYISFGKNGTGKELHVKEESGCMNRLFCNPNHSLKLSITDTRSKTELAYIEKPFKCCCPAFFPCFLKEASIYKVEGGNPVDVGLIKQPLCGGFFTPVLDVYDKKPEDGGAINGKVKGPFCCLGGSFCASDFKLLDKNHVEHAKFRRDGALGKGILRSAATTSDRYELDFEDKALSVDEKLRIVTTALFVDYLFFEGETDCLCLFCEGYCPPKPACPPQIWCKVCDFYCCGCLLPFRVKCCIGEAVDAAVKANTGV